METHEIENLCIQLFDIGVIKFGDFTLKSGKKSNYYIDLRILRSYPKILKLVAKELYKLIVNDQIKYNIICGVPYSALPIATSICIENDIPSIFKRDSVKTYGTKHLIDGLYNKDDICLIIEDVVTTGLSIKETAQQLRKEGLVINDVCFVIDRESEGPKNLLEIGIKSHCLFKISTIMNILHKHGKLDESFTSCVTDLPVSSVTKKIPFNLRLNPANIIQQKLCQIIETKQSNVIFSADLTSRHTLLQMLEIVGPHICCVKTHIDILQDFNEKFIQDLKSLSLKHNFLIMEDRKFSDIGYILQKQYTGGVFQISSWADIVTVHGITGEWSVNALKTAIEGQCKACVLVAEMSCQNNLITKEYTNAVVSIAEKNEDYVIGFVCQRKLSNNPKFLHFTPGVKLGNDDTIKSLVDHERSDDITTEKTTSYTTKIQEQHYEKSGLDTQNDTTKLIGDNNCNNNNIIKEGKSNQANNKDSLGQGYNTPQYVIGQELTDIIIVGRDVYEAQDPLSAILRLKSVAYTS